MAKTAKKEAFDKKVAAKDKGDKSKDGEDGDYEAPEAE